MKLYFINKIFVIGLMVSCLILIPGVIALQLNFDNPAIRWSGINTTGGIYHGYIYENTPYAGSYIMGFKFCPLPYSGKICDRPPVISTSDSRVEFDLPTENVIGYTEVYPRCECLNSTFRDLVPNGANYPSEGDWDIPYDGRHYYARLNVDAGDWERICLKYEKDPETGIERCVEWTYRTPIYFEIDTTVGEGSYLFHVQRDIEQPGSGDWAENDLTVQFGSVDLNFSKYVSGEYQLIPNEAFVSDTVSISGRNSDSNATYMWLTGPGLPSCGINLMAKSIEDTDPYIVKTNPSGSFPQNISWDLSTLPITPGMSTTYEIVVSSVPPTQLDKDCTSCGSSNPCGVQGFDECPICGNQPKRIPFTIKSPDFIANVTSEIERCCCPGYPCGVMGGSEQIILSGTSSANADNNGKKLQFWLFSDNTVGGSKLIFDYLTVDCDGNFKYDINDYIFRKNNISICNLDPGKYYIVLQTDWLNKQFDVVPDKFRTGGIYEPEPNKQYVVSTYPLKWTKSFMYDGTGSLSGNQAKEALIKTFQLPSIDDQIIELNFTIKDNACNGGVDFTANPIIGNTPLNVSFISNSSLNIIEWNWDFGDGQTSIEKNPYHVYSTPGSYSVKLTVSDGSKDKEMNKIGLITVLEGPIADFDYSPKIFKAGETEIQFVDKSTGNPTSWIWQFGDGSSSPLQSPVYTYPEAGNYSVRLTVSNSNGIGPSAIKDIFVQGEPPEPVWLEADFDTVVMDGTKVNFIDRSKGNPEPNEWYWDFGDGNTSTERNPKHTYLKEGTYQVSLTVSNGSYDNTAKKPIGIR